MCNRHFRHYSFNLIQVLYLNLPHLIRRCKLPFSVRVRIPCIFRARQSSSLAEVVKHCGTHVILAIPRVPSFPPSLFSSFVLSGCCADVNCSIYLHFQFTAPILSLPSVFWPYMFECTGCCSGGSPSPPPPTRLMQMGQNDMAGRGILAKVPAPRAPPAA